MHKATNITGGWVKGKKLKKRAWLRNAGDIHKSGRFGTLCKLWELNMSRKAYL